MTINTLDDLIAYSEMIADPEFSEPAVERPGVSADELAELERRFRDLPGSYLRTLAEVRVLGRELGHFRLSPPADEDEDDDEPSFADTLEQWNETHVLADEMQARSRRGGGRLGALAVRAARATAASSSSRSATKARSRSCATSRHRSAICC